MSLAGAYFIGLAFAFGWTPLRRAGAGRDPVHRRWPGKATQGAWLLFVYGFGMTAPFVAAAFFIGPFMRFMAKFRRHLGTVEKGIGALLIIFGVTIATGTVNYIGFWLLNTFPIFSQLG